VSKSGCKGLDNNERARFLSLKRTSTAKINWTFIDAICIFSAVQMQLANMSAALGPHDGGGTRGREAPAALASSAHAAIIALWLQRAHRCYHVGGK
jgi:hypothetical protein